MRSRSEQEEVMTQYLLRRLTAEEESQIEDRFFTDDQFSEQLLAAEDALIDDYIEGRLSADERKVFEELLTSSTQWKADVNFTKNLISSISSMRASKSKRLEPNNKRPFSWKQVFPSDLNFWLLWQRYSFLALILLSINCVYLLISSSNLHAKVEQLEHERATLESKQRELQQIISGNQNTSPPTSLSDVVSIVLESTIVSRGGGEIPSVEMPPDLRQLQIQAELTGKIFYRNYFAAIETVGGRNVWAAMISTSQQTAPDSITLLVPAEKFENEVYILTLRGQSEGGKTVDLSEYPFRVRRKP